MHSFYYLALLASSVAGAAGAAKARTCEHLNATSTYIVQPNDTIFTIASNFSLNVCDLARYNHLSDPELLYASEELYIPPQACADITKDASTSCFLTPQNGTTNTCIYGGPHTYETFAGDTIRKIALNKFNITVEALWGLSEKMARVSSVDDELEAGNSVKIPQCSPSRCAFEPFEYTWGTYRDLANEYNTTPGQIFALNPSFNHSMTGPGVGGWITLPMDCRPLGDFTAVS